jgi:hypothetical protein
MKKVYNVIVERRGEIISAYELTAMNVREAYYTAQRHKYWNKYRGTIRCYLKKDQTIKANELLQD